MEAHAFLRYCQVHNTYRVARLGARFPTSIIDLFCSKKGFHVKSYGTGDKVKLPGPAPDKPNCYEFGITYEEIYQDLLVKDKTLYPFQQDVKYEYYTKCYLYISTLPSLLFEVQLL
jgi:hypothetical protein